MSATATGRAGRRLRQQTWTCEHGSKRQWRDQVDAAVMPDVRGERRAAPASCTRLNLGKFLRTLAMPDLKSNRWDECTQCQ